MATGTGTTTTTIFGNLNTSYSYTYDVNDGLDTNVKRSPISVNLGSFELFNFDIKETLPPNSPFAVNLNNPGVQTTPALARGFLPGSAIELLNNNLTHVCDFKFIFNLNLDLGLGGIDPVGAIRRAIKNAKLAATLKVKSLIQEGIQAARAAIDAILAALNFDPSGQISFYWSLGKSIIRKVQYWIEIAAEAVEKVLYWIFLAKQIKELIEWIKSLPAKIQALLADCVKNFTNSIVQVAQQVKSIPEQIADLTSAQITQLQNQFTAAGNEVLYSIQAQSDSIPPSITSSMDVNQLQTAINEIPSADTLKTQTVYYQFSTMRSA